MARMSIALCLLVLAASTSGSGAATHQTSEPRFALIVESREAQLERTLNDAGARGFALVAAGDYRFVLRRDEGTHLYKVIEATRDSTLLDEMNAAAAEGFRLLPYTATAAGGDWLVVMERQPQGPTYAYVTVKGDAGADAAIKAARRDGATIVAVFGQPGSDLPFGANPVPLLIMEKGGSPVGDERDYRVVSTKRTGKLEEQLNDAGRDGFRPIGSAFMTLVLERSGTQSHEYRVVATTRASTAQREIDALTAEGFCLVALPEAAKEWLFVLERGSGTGQRCWYGLATLDKKTLESTMAGMEATLGRLIGVIDDLGVFEIGPSTTVR